MEPYKFWTRDKLADALVGQAKYFNYHEDEIEFIKSICYDKRWDPIKEFNGCTLIQDVYHPFIPCFIHDYLWIIEGPSIKSNKRFYKDLRKCGMKQAKARRWYTAVTIAIPYYKLKRKFK